MKELVQSLKCLLGSHYIVVSKKVSNSRTELEFVCIHCGKQIGEK